MARVKVTSSDIHARLAKGECANFRNGCQGRMPCAVIGGEACKYFDDYVRPLLDTPEFAQRYSREAKVKLALDPNAKVVRKRRQAGSPNLDITAEPVQTTKPAGARAKPTAVSAKPVTKTPPRAVKPAPALKLAVETAAVSEESKIRGKTPEIPTPPTVAAQPRAGKATALPMDAAHCQAKHGPVAKPDAAPTLQLEVKADTEKKRAAVIPKRAAAAPSPPAVAKTTPAKQAPASAKQTIVTPQLELFALE